MKRDRAALVVALLALQTHAAAQSTGFALDRFDPAERGSRWFALDSLDLRGRAHPAVGIVADYAYRPIVLYAPDGKVRSSIVRDQLFFHIGGTVVLSDRVRLGLDLPIAVYQFGHDAVAGGVAYKAPDTADLGDIRLGTDVRLFGAYGDALTAAAGLQVYLPTGRRVSFSSDETLRIQPRALLAGEIGPFVYAAKLAFEARAEDAVFAGSQLGSELLFGASAGVGLFDKTLVVGPEIYGSTVVGSDDGAFKTRNTPLETILGGHLTLAKEWRVGAGLGRGAARGFGAPAFRLLGSVEWTPPLDEKPRDSTEPRLLETTEPAESSGKP